MITTKMGKNAGAPTFSFSEHFEVYWFFKMKQTKNSQIVNALVLKGIAMYYF